VYESSAPFVWTLVSAPDGSTYAGTGNEGQVFKTDPSGKTTVFFDAEELEVHAIAFAPGGGLYVGTSPDGKIYKVDATGKGTVFFDPADRYIWSLAVDRTGNLFAATGDKGVIYKITPDGKGAPFYQTKATHAMTLAFDREGRLLAGTESPGRVFQIDASGKPFVLLDSSYNEIHQLRVAPDGMIYAAAVRGRSPNSGRVERVVSSTPDNTPAPVPSVTTEITASPSSTHRRSHPAPRPRLARRSDRQRARFSESHRMEHPTRSGNLARTRRTTSRSNRAVRCCWRPGTKARSIDSPAIRCSRRWSRVRTRIRSRRCCRIAAPRGLCHVEPGKIFRLSSDRAARGTYTSDVRDAQTVAAWGAIKWQAQAPTGTKIEIATRSGNTRTPDETWSDWSPAYTQPRAARSRAHARAICSGGAC
jgi:sugar lactone lactonase YvrE